MELPSLSITSDISPNQKIKWSSDKYEDTGGNIWNNTKMCKTEVQYVDRNYVKLFDKPYFEGWEGE